MTDKSIIDAWAKIRESDLGIPDDVLVVMRDAALKEIRNPQIVREARVNSFLTKMLETDKELYERILDTDGFAYYFNNLVLMAMHGRHGMKSPGRRSPGRRSPGRRSPGRRSPGRRSPGRRSPGRGRKLL